MSREQSVAAGAAEALASNEVALVPFEQGVSECQAITYASHGEVCERRLGHSTEETVFERVPHREGEDAILLEASRRAALAYGEVIRKMTLGVLGPGPRDREEKLGPSLYVRPFGVHLIEMMGFGQLTYGGERQGYYLPVERGLLAASEPQGDGRGRLAFRWYRDGEDEVFQTRMSDYVPRLAGASRGWIGLRFYRATQMMMHALVMWGYHLWVKRHRDELLESARVRALGIDES